MSVMHDGPHVYCVIAMNFAGHARPATRHHLDSKDAIRMAGAVQAAFQDAGAVPALLQLLQLGPDHPTAGAAARALLVLLFDFHRAPAWL